MAGEYGAESGKYIENIEQNWPVLASLLSMGMGLEEISRLVQKRTGQNVSEADVREACRDVCLLGEPPSHDYHNARRDERYLL